MKRSSTAMAKRHNFPLRASNSSVWNCSTEKLLEAVKLCHQLGNDPAQTNSMGLGAIHAAPNRGSTSIVEYLASVGAPLDTPDNERR